MKSKIAFVSADSFVDVDMPILKEINESFDITWFCIKKENARYSDYLLDSFAKSINIDLKIVSLKGRRRSLRNFKTYWTLFSSLKFSSYDLIYFEYMGDPYSFFLSLFIPRSKKIFAIHDVLLHSNFSSFTNRILHYSVPYSFKYIHTFSKTQNDLLKLKYHKRNSFVIPLSKKNSGIINSNRPNIENGLRLLFFGGIHSYKRLDVLINAIEKLGDEIDVSLTIAGKGPDWEKMEDLIKTKSLYNLRIGFIPTESIPDLFNSHHFIVLPYQDVTQSGPLFDAFNFDLPAIVSDQPGFLEFLVDNETGFVFETNSVENLASLIRYLSSMQQNDYEELLLKLNKYSEKYTSSIVAKKYSEMFSSIKKLN